MSLLHIFKVNHLFYSEEVSVDSGWREMCNHSSSSLGVDDFDFAFAFAFAYLLIDSMKSDTFVKLSDDRKK
jgi:hypothetical protein